MYNDYNGDHERFDVPSGRRAAELAEELARERNYFRRFEIVDHTFQARVYQSPICLQCGAHKSKHAAR